MNNDIEQILISKEEIQEAAKRIGDQINVDYKDKSPIFVSVLKGALMWTADILTNVDISCEIEFINISSYHGGLSSHNEIELIGDLNTTIDGRDVIIIEDIVDTGQSLTYLIDLLKSRNAASVKVVSMLDKKSGRKVDTIVDYSGFDIDNVFIVGYGLDYQERYRNLSYIGVLKSEVYKQ